MPDVADPANAFRARRRRHVLGAGALLILAAASACSGPATSRDDSSPAPTASASASASPKSAPVSVGALTGLPVPADVVRRAAVAVVVNGPGTAVGANLADAVYVEMGSAATSRAIALFQSKDAVVGPIGETRPVDARILPVLHPVTVYSGGAVGQVEQIRKAEVIDAGLGTAPALYTRRPDGTLTVDTAAARRFAPTAKPPVIPFRFANPGETLSSTPVRPVTSVHVSPAGQPALAWTYDPRTKRWHTTAALGGGTVPLSAASVLVQQVVFKTATSRAAPVPVADVFGTGKLTVFSGGALVEGTWSKSGVASATLYRDPTGAPLRLAPGPVVVLFVPVGTATR